MTRYAGRSVLVVGLGKSGASAARYLVKEGAQVAAVDSRRDPPNLAEVRDLAAIELQIGTFAVAEPLRRFHEAVLSPGVSLKEPLVQGLRDAGVPVVGDIELFARAANAPIVGITGANGKSTVTTLVGAMATRAGLRAPMGANLGTPALDLLHDDAQAYVLELSSFQLELTSSLRCRAATVLNISEDHLDRHGSLAAYVAAKSRIYAGCETAVVNRGDALAAQGSEQAGRRVSFGVDRPDADQYGLVTHDGELWLACGTTRLIPYSSLKIYGLHNAANALAALALAEAAGLPRAACLDALHDFPGLAHRCEWAGEIGGVTWFNDSKGTNVGATLAAVEGLPGPIVWIGGGQGKGQDFAPLRTPLRQKARAAILFGEDAPVLAQALEGGPPIYREATLEHAVRRAFAVARKGDQVLLSPACASFDQFKNYEERGRRFCQAVQKLAA